MLFSVLVDNIAANFGPQNIHVPFTTLSAYVFTISYPWCVSLLLNHVHSRQLVWEKAASPQSRIVNLKATRRGRLFSAACPHVSQETTNRQPCPSALLGGEQQGKMTPSLHLVSHAHTSGGAWQDTKTNACHTRAPSNSILLGFCWIKIQQRWRY